MRREFSVEASESAAAWDSHPIRQTTRSRRADPVRVNGRGGSAPESLICAPRSEVREELSDPSVEVRGMRVPESFNEVEVDLFSHSEL